MRLRNSKQVGAATYALEDARLAVFVKGADAREQAPAWPAQSTIAEWRLSESSNPAERVYPLRGIPRPFGIAEQLD